MLIQNLHKMLGSWFDRHVFMDVHVGKVCSKAFRGLYNIRQIRKFLSIECTKTLVHAFVTSHLDYCNSLLFGISQYQIKRLQWVLNAAARITCFTPRCSHITPASCTYTGCLSNFALSLKSHSLFTKLSMGWLLITLLISCKKNRIAPTNYDLTIKDYSLFLKLEPRLWGTEHLRTRARQYGRNYHITLEILNQMKILNLN